MTKKYQRLTLEELLDLYVDKVQGHAVMAFWCGRQKDTELEILDVEEEFHRRGIYWDKLKPLYDAADYAEPEDGGASTGYYEKLQEKLKKQILQDVKGGKYEQDCRKEF